MQASTLRAIALVILVIALILMYPFKRDSPTVRQSSSNLPPEGHYPTNKPPSSHKKASSPTHKPPSSPKKASSPTHTPPSGSSKSSPPLSKDEEIKKKQGDLKTLNDLRVGELEKKIKESGEDTNLINRLYLEKFLIPIFNSTGYYLIDSNIKGVVQMIDMVFGKWGKDALFIDFKILSVGTIENIMIQSLKCLENSITNYYNFLKGDRIQVPKENAPNLGTLDEINAQLNKLSNVSFACVVPMFNSTIDRLIAMELDQKKIGKISSIEDYYKKGVFNPEGEFFKSLSFPELVGEGENKYQTNQQKVLGLIVQEIYKKNYHEESLENALGAIKDYRKILVKMKEGDETIFDEFINKFLITPVASTQELQSFRFKSLLGSDDGEMKVYEVKELVEKLVK